jgi:type IV secretory pathway VirB10-like protein
MKIREAINTLLAKKHAKKIVAVLAISMGAALLMILTNLNKKPKNDGYVEQNYVMSDEYYNTTPRITEKTRVIVVMKNKGALKITEELDERGEVVSRKSEFLPLDYIRRGDKILRNGEEVQEGDILSEDLIEKGGVLYRRQTVFQNGDIKIVEYPLEDGEYKQVDGEENRILASTGEVGEEKLLRDGEVIKEEIIIENGQIRKTRSIVRNGKISREEEQGSKGKGFDIFEFSSSNPDISDDELDKINRLQAQRNTAGEVKLIEYGRERKRSNYPLRNRDKDFSAHKESKTIATYPVDLSRVITMDKNIPAVLYTELKSEIPSEKVVAVVEKDVVGSHGRKILIPRGSKVIGSYKAVSEQGARRVGIAWYRIITPEGINIRLESELADQEGASGIGGKIDRRLKDRYGAALLFSSINALAQLSVPVDNQQGKAAADAFTRELGGITAQALRETLNLVPRITVPKGTRINISPLQDIWFKEPEGSEVKVVVYEG